MTKYKLIGDMTPERTLRIGGLSLYGKVVLAFLHNPNLTDDWFAKRLRKRLLKEGFIKPVGAGA